MSGSCLDCPFRRDAERGLPYGEDPFSFYMKYVFNQNEYAEYEPYICEESGEVCYGQLVCMKNMNVGWIFDPLSNIEDLLSGVEVDRETYFDGAYQFIHYHEGGPLFSLDWFRNVHGEGNKKAKDTVPILPR